MKIFAEYIENSFSGLPQSNELQNIKQDMLANMEDKYDELISSGLSPHEAIGSVIVDFGDVDELLVELGYKTATGHDTPETAEFMPLSRIRDYIEQIRLSALLVGFGVSWILLGVALIVLIDEMAGFNGTFDSFPLPILVFIAMSVAAFIYSGSRLSDYDDLDEWFLIKNETRQVVEAEYNRLKNSYTQQIITGVIMLIVSPVIILFADSLNNKLLSQISIPIILSIVSLAVFILIVTGITSNAYSTILENGKSVSVFYQQENKCQSQSNLVSKLSGVLWLIVPLIFFLWGILGDGWHIAWVVFPIAGVLQAVLGVLMGTEE